MMIKNSYPLIMHIPTDTKWTQPLINEYRDKLMNGGEIIHCASKFSGVTVMQIHDFAYERQRASKKSGLEKGDTEILSRRVYVHIYFSSLKKAEEDIKFRMQFDAVKSDLLSGAYLTPEDQRFADQYMEISYWGERITGIEVKKKAYEKRGRYHGFIILVASKEKDTNRALEKYRSQEYVEENFKNSKSHTGGNHPRVRVLGYMVRSRKGIEMLVNLINIAYCAMKVRPYQDEIFSKYQNESTQEIRFALSERIRQEAFFANLVENTERGKKSIGIMDSAKQWFRKQCVQI